MLFVWHWKFRKDPPLVSNIPRNMSMVHAVLYPVAWSRSILPMSFKITCGTRTNLRLISYHGRSLKFMVNGKALARNMRYHIVPAIGRSRYVTGTRLVISAFQWSKLINVRERMSQNIRSWWYRHIKTKHNKPRAYLMGYIVFTCVWIFHIV